jgi:uncharacterized protein
VNFKDTTMLKRIEQAGAGRRRRNAAEVLLGLPALIIGAAIGVPHLIAGITITAILGIASLAVGIVLLGAAIADGWRAARWRGRTALVAVLFLVAQFVVFPVSTAVFATNRAPMPLPATTPADVGLDHRDVTLSTDDGVELAAWYIPSTNGAAVILRHGSGSTRANVLTHARVLADNGFGVLMADARGHGESGGREMDFGWFGDADIAPAVGYLQTAEDVIDDRIAAVGLSMGGEELLGAAASLSEIRAVVAEGATGRTGEDWLPLRPDGAGRWFSTAFYWVQDTTSELVSGAHRPVDLRSAVEAVAPRPVLLIAAGEVDREAAAALRWQQTAPDSVTVWKVARAGHTDGLRTAPELWERRVVSFLAEALDVQPS